MSNLATVQALYGAFGSGDIDGFIGHLAEDVQWESWADNQAVAAGVPWLQAYGDRDAVRGFFAAVSKMEIVELQILNMMEGGNEVAVSFILEARLPECGDRPYRDEEIHLWTFNDRGQVSRLRHYVDTAKHIKATNGQRGHADCSSSAERVS